MDRFKRLCKRNPSVLMGYVLAVLMFTAVSAFRPEFASASHIKVMLLDAALLGILAIGQTFVILVGGIDLSIQWTMCASGIMFTMLYKSLGLAGGQMWLLILFCLAVTTTVGLINGIGVAYLDINPMIMTFGTNTIVQGLVVALTSKTLPGGYAPENFKDLILGSVLHIPNLVLFWAIMIAIVSITLMFTPYGRKVYAVGNSETVAYYSGIKVKFIKMLTYAISGFAGGLGGILFTGRFGQAYLGMGDFILFQSVAVVAIGGTSMIGGSGNYFGTVAGTLILTILNGLLSAFLIPAAVQQIVYGVILILAVLITFSRNKRLRAH